MGLAFASPGTSVGTEGIAELEAAVQRRAADSVEFERERLRSGLTVSAVAFLDGEPVGAGSHQPVGSVSEIVGVATLPRLPTAGHRQRHDRATGRRRAPTWGDDGLPVGGRRHDCSRVRARRIQAHRHRVYCRAGFGAGHRISGCPRGLNRDRLARGVRGRGGRCGRRRRRHSRPGAGRPYASGCGGIGSCSSRAWRCWALSRGRLR